MNKGIFDRVSFTKEDREMLNLLKTLSGVSDFVEDNVQHIMVRKKTLELPGNVDTFVIATSAHPDSEIFYTSSLDVVDLNTRDGGFF
jgi:hypothetical protein